MIPGKKLKPEDILEMAWRRRWVIVLPFAVIGLGTAAWVHGMPNRYRSDATILVVPPQVPVTYVKPTITTKLDQRLQSLTQRILSRTQLEQIINDFSLYANDRKAMLMDEIVDRMRTQDIKINVVKPKSRKAEPDHFDVSFESENPRTAMLVTERLASLFVNANLEDRALQADTTSQFLQSQAEDARKRMLQQEQKVTEYKRLHGAELPSQQVSNMHAIETTQQQIQQLEDSVNHDRDRKLMLERMLAEEESTVVQKTGGKDKGVAADAPASQQLDEARATLRDLELRLTPDHPDVIHQKRVVADLEKKADAEALQAPVGTAAPQRVLSPAESAHQKALIQMRTELDAIDRRLASAQSSEQRLEAQLGTYRGYVEAAPVREAELSQLEKDYAALETNYQGVQKKSDDSAMAASLERRQIGEQFRMVEPPRMPDVPSEPNRLRFNAIGLGAGLALGIGLAVLLEYRNTSLRTEDDVFLALALPVVAIVPTLTTAAERLQSRRRRAWLASSAALMAVGLVAAYAWKLRLFDLWSR